MRMERASRRTWRLPQNGTSRQLSKAMYAILSPRSTGSVLDQMQSTLPAERLERLRQRLVLAHNATLKANRRLETFPVRANFLGFDSVFVQFHDERGVLRGMQSRPFAELVFTTRPCTWPTERDLARLGGAEAKDDGRLRACVPHLEHRRGWAGSLRPCRCTQAEVTLSCEEG